VPRAQGYVEFDALRALNCSWILFWARLYRIKAAATYQISHTGHMPSASACCLEDVCNTSMGSRLRACVCVWFPWPPPTPPHLVAGPPRSPPRPGRQENSPARPLGVPTKSHSLTKNPPPWATSATTAATSNHRHHTGHRQQQPQAEAPPAEKEASQRPVFVSK
jgi:hypothetical protein